MTDTTDIAALLGNLKFYAGEASCHPDPNYYLEFEKLCTPLNILTVVGVLEAERQRSAGSEEELHKALHREKAAERKLLAAQEEIAALKSKLTNPVVLPAGYSTRAGHPFHEGERNVMIPNKHGDWLSRFDVEHAIHVAGFPFANKEE